jgi:predicted transglutaminase-like cysteine proteinase
MFRLAQVRDTAVWCAVAFSLAFAGFVAGDAVANSDVWQGARDQAEWNPVSRPDHALTQKARARSDAKPVPTFADRALRQDDKTSLDSQLAVIKIPASTDPSLPKALTRAKGLEAANIGMLRSSSGSSEQMKLAALDPSDRSPDTLAPVIPPVTIDIEPFGFIAEQTLEGPMWAKWRELRADIERDMRILALCRATPKNCPAAAQRFLAIIETARARSGRARLGEVNRTINFAISATSDLAQHGVLDRWSSPLSTLSSGRGDCEDYAIAKYIALRETGIADNDLRLVIVRNVPLRSDHAVLTVRLDGRWIVLDNRHLNLVEANEISHLIPLFVVDLQGVKQVVKKVATRLSTDVPASR